MTIRSERGFAIPVTVLLIALITVMLTSGFARVRADRQVAESQEVSAEALAVARAGLASFLDGQSTRPPDGVVDTVWVTGGYAIVTASVVQNPADTLASQTWIVRATGYVIDAATGAVPRARRTVAQFAEWQSGAIRVRAAWSAADGIQKPGGPPGALPTYIDGTDACSGDPTGGLRASIVTGPPGKTITTSGTPAYEPAEAGLADSSRIDWQDVVDGGIRPDYTTPQYNNWSYPVTIVTGDLTATSGSPLYGSGLLIVMGRLRITGWMYWSGIVLVGDDFDATGSFQIVYGSLQSGLNDQLGTLGGARSNLGTNLTMVRYNSCSVTQALAALTGFAPIENAWVDNWATY